MFELDDRRSLTSCLLPPTGYTFEAALATTYSLDFVALTVALGALANVPALAGEAPTPREMLRTLLKVRDRVLIFGHQAQIHPPGAGGPKRLYALYDSCTRVVTSSGHAFHPKLWLVKYASPTGPARYRLVCSSRNLTRARTIECAVVLEGALANRRSSIGVDVAGYCAELTTTAKRVPPQVLQLIHECERVRFSPPQKCASAFFWGQSAQSESLIRRLPNRMTDVVIVSPFVSAAFLHRILPVQPGAVVISRQEELDCIADAAWSSLEDRATWFVANAEHVGSDSPTELHAKLLLFSDGRTHRAVIGSANATGAAWGLAQGGKNWEAAVALDGGPHHQHFVRNVIAPVRRGEHGWLQPYVRRVAKQDAWKERVEDIQRTLSCLELLARRDRLRLKVHVTKGVSIKTGLRVQLKIAPFALDHLSTTYRSFTPSTGCAVHFDGIIDADVSQFFTVTVHEWGGRRSHAFTLRAVAAWDEAFVRRRDAAALRASADSIDVVEMLLERLGYVGGSYSGRDKRTGHGRRGAPSKRRQPRGVLDAVLRAWVTQPEELARVYDDLKQFAGGQPAALQLLALIDRVRSVPLRRAVTR